MIKDMADDEATQATNDDASECKRNAVQLGYWPDGFIGLFVKQAGRKAPEINRGYYARVKGIEVFIDKFLKVIATEKMSRHFEEKKNVIHTYIRRGERRPLGPFARSRLTLGELEKRGLGWGWRRRRGACRAAATGERETSHLDLALLQFNGALRDSLCRSEARARERVTPCLHLTSPPYRESMHAFCTYGQPRARSDPP